MSQNIKSKNIFVFKNKKNKEPFNEWLNSIRDLEGKKRIAARIIRLQYGLYGDCEPVGEGVFELRMFFGPGYRVYFGEHQNKIIILLCGGDKSSQHRDIEKAKQYWFEYKENESSK